MAEGTYKLIKKNSEGTYDEKEVQAESGKVLGFDSGLDPVMVDPGTSGDSVTDVFVEQDPQFPIEYLKYTKDGVDYDVTAIAKANGLIWGGFVSWVGLLIFSVTPALYYLFAVLYKILETTIITLDAADPDNPRIDVIAVDNTSSVIVIKGTPAANPQKPSIDPETQIELTYVLIPAGATEPENIDQSIIYDENTEWTGAGSGVTVDFDNATSPFHLSKCASVGSIDNNDTVTFTTGVPVDVTDFKNLILYLKLKAAMTSQHNLFASFMRSGVLVSNEVVLSISKTNITTWQSIAIQLTAFTWSQSTVDALRLRWSKSGPSVAHAGFYLDFVKLETGIIQQVVNSAIILTGDVTGSGTTGSPVPTTLATVNANVGQFGDATNIPKITVDGKGRVTAIENVAVTIPTAITPTSDALPVDTDEVVSLRGTSWLKTTWTVLKAFLKTYFDGVYSAINHAHTFISLTDTPAAYTGMAGKVAKVNVGENAIEFGDPGAGATTFLALSDTPDAYTGQAGKYPKVNAGETALEFDIPGAGDFATKALDNLASTAVNASIIPASDSAIDLGSSAKYWANLYVDTIYSPVINGDTVANGSISIQGTTHSTRDTSYVILQSNGGKVGITTSTPVCRLDLGGYDSYNSQIKAGSVEIGSYNINSAYMTNNAYWNTAWRYRRDGIAGFFGFLNGKFHLNLASSGSQDTDISWSDTVQFTGGWTKFGLTDIVPVCRFDIGTHDASNSLLKCGGLELGSYAVNSVYLCNNSYYNGAWKYRATGVAGKLGFLNGKLHVDVAVSGSAGNNITWADTITVYGGWTKFGLTDIVPVCRFDIGTHDTANSILKAGGLELMSYANNSLYYTFNSYYSGGWKYRASSYAGYIGFANGEFWFCSIGSGTAGGAITFNRILTMSNSGKSGFGVDSPTAIIHLKAGTATASTAPLKFTSGTLLSSTEAGAVEFLTDTYYVTITTGSARKGIITDDGSRLTSGKIPVATTNGRLIDGQTPLAGTKVYYVADSSEGAATRKLTFVNGILTSET